MITRQTGVIRAIQIELFTVEVALSEFEIKRKALKAKLAKLGVGTKVCTKCKTEMDIDQFGNSTQPNAE